MPPRKVKSGGKNKSSAKQSTISDTQARRCQHSCDGCAETISVGDTEALNCCMCKVWLHRYCAGIPQSRCAAIASSFICTACSILANSSIVVELRSEIAALKAEVSELRSALNTANQKLENVLSQDEAPAARQTASNNTIKLSLHPRSKRRIHPHRNNINHPQPLCATSIGLATTQRKLRIPVEGKRKLWGTRKTTTAADIIHTINSQTSIKTGLDVKRKYKSRPGNPHAVSKWWYVISGEEDLLKQLQGEWEAISLHTNSKWLLEPLLCFSTDSESASNPPISSDATLTSTTIQKPTGESTNPLLLENGSTLTQNEVAIGEYIVFQCYCQC